MLFLSFKPRTPLRLGGQTLVGLLGLAYAWILLTPLVPSVGQAGLRRFNLVSGSFVSWALQQPVPSMYNFSNEVAFGPLSLVAAVPLRQVNHYPTRFYTGSDREIYTKMLPMLMRSKSSYRGNDLQVYHLIEEAPGGVKMVAAIQGENDD